MMFVPFTGIDNHRRSVTLGAGLLNNESSDSYIWLLNAFVNTFGVQPRIIVTDQDKSMKKAVETVLTESKHRLCMWHITNKLPGKILHDVPDDKEFKKKFNKIIWNMWITPEQFEEEWAKLMDEYKTQNHKWLKKIYDIRSTWIPAYFADVELCGLMRTTSRSESENSFFGAFNNKRSTLVNFMLCFENAMEKQRYNQDVLDHQTTQTIPKYKTQLKIEKHAAKVYTRTIFNLVQIEIVKSLWECSIDALRNEDAFQEYLIKETRKYTDDEMASNEDWEVEFWPEDKKTRTYHYKVLYGLNDGSVDCNCKKFTRRGILCRHIFCVLKNRNIEEIPSRYILRRWTKNLIPVEVRKRKRIPTDCEQLSCEASSCFEECLQIIGKNEEKMADFVTKLKKIKMDIEASTLEAQPQSKNDVIEELHGIKRPDAVEIQNPDILRYKGCGRDKRLMSAKEKAIKSAGKRKNNCGKCGKTGHNATSCERKTAEAKAKAEAREREKEQANTSRIAE